MGSWKSCNSQEINSPTGSRCGAKRGQFQKIVAYCIQAPDRGAVARTSIPHFPRPNSRLLVSPELHPVSGGTTGLGFSNDDVPAGPVSGRRPR
jgi:hypothetical protein